MKRNLPTAFLSMAFLFAAHGVSAQSIFMSSIGYPDSVAIEVVVTDPGGGPAGCDWLGVIRGGDVIAVIARQAGTSTHHVVDTNVEPSTIYCYRMALLMYPVPVPIWCGGDVGSLCQVFDCFYDIQTCVNTGPDPAFLGHGYLTSEGAVPNEVAAFIEPCDPTAYATGLFRVSGTAQAYVDSGTAVDVFGTMERGGMPQGVWYFVAEAATPHSCTIAVQHKSWGAVKVLYKK